MPDKPTQVPTSTASTDSTDNPTAGPPEKVEFNPQPDPPGAFEASKTAKKGEEFNPQPDPPGSR